MSSVSRDEERSRAGGDAEQSTISRRDRASRSNRDSASGGDGDHLGDQGKYTNSCKHHHPFGHLHHDREHPLPEILQGAGE